ncbi:MAG: VCBS repeat-containing protein, partial [Planctomycetes bacterium]|nr:VCBS repeat-containing protein [Planctomycetota bacterium]
MRRLLFESAVLVFCAAAVSIAGCQKSFFNRSSTQQDAREEKAREAYREGRLSDAEKNFRQTLQEKPEHVEANRWLARILNVEGRRWEATPFLFRLVRSGRFSIEELILLAHLDAPYVDARVLEQARRAVPDDPTPQIGQALADVREHRDQQALAALRQIVAERPRLLDAQALLGRALVKLDDHDAFLRWQRQLPDGADAHPEVWFVRGRWAQKHDQPEAAMRCFWEAVRRAPNHQRALQALGSALQLAGRRQEATPFLQRAGHLIDLRDLAHMTFRQGPGLERMTRTAELMEQLGRPWEAWAWNVALLAHFPEHETAQAARDRLHAFLQEENPPRTLASANPALSIDFENGPLPRWDAEQGLAEPAKNVKRADIHFQDVAAEVGLDFTFFNTDHPERRPIPIYEQSGGGVAVLDFDVDGRPDLHLTQNGPWPPKPESSQYRDRFYRNVAGRQFQDITEQAGLQETAYSQGATVGDFNSDGFPDLYVANLGRNRLFQNNGDGTFTEATPPVMREGLWTTSCVMADLNGDAHPDIYDVNYLVGKETFDEVCANEENLCGPTLFEGEHDQIYLNRGDGRWERATEQCGVAGLRGKGMGVVAADFDEDGRLSLFVANDGVANFFLAPQTQGAGFRLADQAPLLGLATDVDGRSQACMGVAVGDSNADGLLDLFVSNFSDESNTLYRQYAGRLFVVETRECRLLISRLSFVGFGSQFLEDELDGRPDLVVANGHVHDADDNFLIRPQYFQNLGG